MIVRVTHAIARNSIRYSVAKKEEDKLPQINLLLVFGEKSGILFYDRKLVGNITDSKIVKRLLGDMDILVGKSNLEDVYDDSRMSNNFVVGINTYYCAVNAEWNCIQDRPYIGDTIEVSSHS